MPSASGPNRPVLIQADATSQLIQRWKDDPGGTYQTWFLWEERLKNFRSIRRGIAEVVDEIEAGSFGSAYKGSSLETVVGSIAEQRQMFKGADHAFLWKPKLRIPDIYENREHQLAFGRFLHACACCDTETEVLASIAGLSSRGIKGLGPAAANLLYFLHPTIAPPFNTAIVRGYNALTGGRVKLGRWDEYLAMRAGIIELNQRYRPLLSNDLGAVAALLFDIGTGRYVPPPLDSTWDAAARAAWETELARIREAAAVADGSNRALARARDDDKNHTQVQRWLRDLGHALGFRVWIAANDQGRACGAGRLGDGCLDALPDAIAAGPGAEAIRLIDVLWLESRSDHVAAAFEVEHTTSIYSGIMRLLDLALGQARVREGATGHGLFLVAPDDREAEVRAQLVRPAFSRVADLKVRYLPYSELERHREAMARFGHGLKGDRGGRPFTRVKEWDLPQEVPTMPSRSARPRLVRVPFLVAAMLLLAISAGLLRAHDFWIVPIGFTIDPSGPMEIRGQTSTRFPTTVSAVTPERVAAARLISATAEEPFTDLSVGGKSLLLRHRPTAPGQRVVAVALVTRSSRAATAGLKRYIALEGAPDLAERYEREGAFAGGDSLTQLTTKYAKTVVEVGRSGARAYQRLAGHALEFVPLEDPAVLRVGDSLPVRLLFRGGPLAEAHIHAGGAPERAVDDSGAAAQAAADLSLTTNHEGVALVRLDRPGLWNVRTLHAALSGSSAATWEVAFATLVFRVQER